MSIVAALNEATHTVFDMGRADALFVAPTLVLVNIALFRNLQ